MSVKIIYMGTPEFAVPALKAIHKEGHQIVAVYSQPPRPAQRGHKVMKSPVQQVAEELGLPVFTPESLKDQNEQKKFSALEADVGVVAAFGMILPRAILEAPKYGCINIHASLLPRWRGAAPIQRAILAGDKETGITIMQMDESLDTGAILLQDIVPITAETTASDLYDRLADLGSRMVLDVLDDLETGNLDPRSQPTKGVTYAEKLRRDEGKIDWFEAAYYLERKIHAFNPWPGTWFKYKEQRIKVLDAEVTHLHIDGKPGTVLDEQLTVACAEGALRILRVQKPGGREMETFEFLRGTSIPAGERLE